jgi:hypothetical protein
VPYWATWFLRSCGGEAGACKNASTQTQVSVVRDKIRVRQSPTKIRSRTGGNVSLLSIPSSTFAVAMEGRVEISPQRFEDPKSVCNRPVASLTAAPCRPSKAPPKASRQSRPRGAQDVACCPLDQERTSPPLTHPEAVENPIGERKPVMLAPTSRETEGDEHNEASVRCGGSSRFPWSRNEEGWAPLRAAELVPG